MALSLSEETREAFNLATMRKAAREHLTHRQWSQVRDIRERYIKLTNNEKICYDKEYETRVEQTRNRLLNERGKPNHTLEHPWAQRDLFNADSIRRQAHREVQHAHANRLTQLVRQEKAEVEDVVERAGVANKVKDKMRSEFERRADRRRGPDRREMVRERTREE